MPRARDFVTSLLAFRGVAEVSDDIRICVSELAANAVRYGPRGRDFLVGGATRGSVVRIEVHDAGDGSPRMRAPAHGDDRRRGPLVVAALADGWGVCDRTGPGKAVWVEFNVGERLSGAGSVASA